MDEHSCSHHVTDHKRDMDNSDKLVRRVEWVSYLVLQAREAADPEDLTPPAHVVR